MSTREKLISAGFNADGSDSRGEHFSLKVAALALLIVVAVLTGAFAAAARVNKLQDAADLAANITEAGSVLLRTVQHDGHSWVVAGGVNGGAHVVHHPNCPCRHD